MNSFDYDTYLTNRALVKVVGNIVASRGPGINATAEEIVNYDEAKNIIEVLKNKAGEGSNQKTQFQFKINENMTVSQVLRKIEELQITDIQSEIQYIKGEVFYKSTLEDDRAQRGENLGYGNIRGAQGRGAVARGQETQGDEVQDRPGGGFWKRAAKDTDGDVYVEASLISFLDVDKKIIDWEVTLGNLNRIGTERGYTNNNYRASVLRIIQVYQPHLNYLYRDIQNANEIATSLMESQLKLDKRMIYRNQVNELVRKPNEDLTQVMSNLKSLGKLIYPNPNQDSNLHQLMIKGLISFTHDDLAMQLKSSIEKDVNLGRPVNWEEHFDVIQQLEILRGIKPTTPLKFGRSIGDKPLQLFNYEFPNEIQDFYTGKYKEFLKPGILNSPRQIEYTDDDFLNLQPTPTRPIASNNKSSGATPKSLPHRTEYGNIPILNESIDFSSGNPFPMHSTPMKKKEELDDKEKLVARLSPSQYGNIPGSPMWQYGTPDKTLSPNSTLEEQDFESGKIKLGQQNVSYQNVSNDNEITFQNRRDKTMPSINYTNTYPVQYGKHSSKPNYSSNNNGHFSKGYRKEGEWKVNRSQSRERPYNGGLNRNRSPNYGKNRFDNNSRRNSYEQDRYYQDNKWGRNAYEDERGRDKNY